MLTSVKRVINEILKVKLTVFLQLNISFVLTMCNIANLLKIALKQD